jgi:uncharacterized membrane protein
MCVLIIDAAWITTMKRMYEYTVRRVQKAPLYVNTYGVIVSYSIVVVLLIMFVFPQARAAVESKKYDNKFTVSLRYGGLLGMLTYGMFNATNVAIFEYYNIPTAIIDTIWGGVLFTVATLLYLTLNSDVN